MSLTPEQIAWIERAVAEHPRDEETRENPAREWGKREKGSPWRMQGWVGKVARGKG